MRDAILRILALTRKELLAVLKDPRGRFTLFVPPIFQCLLFGYAATYDLMVPAAIDRNGAVNVKDLEFQQDYYLRTGTQATAINLKDVVDPEFAEYAVSVLGRQ